MNFKIIFFLIFFTQASASFFDVFRGAMSSVAESFENLMSDVVTDVRNTIDCSILAVKQVLALGGEFADEADYDRICKGKLDTTTTKTNVLNTSGISLHTLDSVSTLAPTVEIVESTKLETHNMSKIIDSAVQNVKDKISILNDTSNIHKKFEDTKNTIKQDISTKLHTELDNITNDVKKILRGAISHSDKKGILQDIDKPKINLISPPKIISDNILDGIISSAHSKSNQSTVPIVISKELNETLSLVKHQLEDQEKDSENGKTKEIESMIKTFEKVTGHDGQNVQTQTEANKGDHITYKVVSKEIEVPKLTSTLVDHDSYQNDVPNETLSLVKHQLKDQEKDAEDGKTKEIESLIKTFEKVTGHDEQNVQTQTEAKKGDHITYNVVSKKIEVPKLTSILVDHDSNQNDESNETLSLVKHQLEDQEKNPADGKTKEIESVIKTFEKVTGHDKQNVQTQTEANKGDHVTYKVVSKKIEIPKLTSILVDPDSNQNDEPNETLSLVKHQLEDQEKDSEDGKTKEIESVIKTFEKVTGHDKENVQTQIEANKGDHLTYKVVSKKIEVPKLTPILNDDSYQNEEPFDQASVESEKDQEKIIQDYSVYGFHQITKSSESRKAAFKSLIEDSRLTDNIMSSYFSKAGKVGKSVFDNVDLLT